MTAPEMKISTEKQFIHVETPGFNDAAILKTCMNVL